MNGAPKNFTYQQAYWGVCSLAKWITDPTKMSQDRQDMDGKGLGIVARLCLCSAVDYVMKSLLIDMTWVTELQSMSQPYTISNIKTNRNIKKISKSLAVSEIRYINIQYLVLSYI